MRVGLACTACHTEHNGREFRPAVVANTACTVCHRDGSDYISPLTNQRLKTPHGGTFGYPVKDGVWAWEGISEAEWLRRELPGATSQFTRKEQFHLIHVAGRQQGRTNCTDCHTAGFVGDAVRQGVRESCAACHGIGPEQAGTRILNAGLAFLDNAKNRMGAVAGGPSCASCHAQHGEEKELRASLRRDAREALGNLSSLPTASVVP